MKKTATKKKAAPANKVKVPFGKWVKEIARARGLATGGLIGAIRVNKEIRTNTTLDKARAILGKNPSFPAIEARYNGYLRRGPQSKAA